MSSIARREAHQRRMQEAKEREEYYRAVLSTFDRPGGARRYDDRAQAQAMRRLYLRAYACLYSKTPKGLAFGRARDSNRRVSPRRPRPPGVPEFYFNMLNDAEAVCFYCERSLQPHERVGDHFVPLSKGGEHAEQNLVIACNPCNSEKSDQLPADFIASRYFG